MTRYSKKPFDQILKLIPTCIINELVPAVLAENEIATAMQEQAATTQPKTRNSKKKPIRTEILPDWFDESQNYYKAPEQPKTETPAPTTNSIMSKINAFRETPSREVNNLWG